MKIFLSPFAYYVRLDTDDFEESQKQGGFQKWVDNRKGRLMYEFLEFNPLISDFDLDFPKVVNNIELIKSRLLCYHPFDHKTSVSDKAFQAMKINSNSDYELHMLFQEKQSNRLHQNASYYTKSELPFIRKISFHVDESTSNLTEIIEYSDNSKKSFRYHLIAKTHLLQKPEWYARFVFS